MSVVPASSQPAPLLDLIPQAPEAREEEYGGMVAVAILFVAALMFAAGLATALGLLGLLLR